MPLRTPKLNTHRLVLRPLADTEAVFALQSNARILRSWDAPPWTTRAQAESFIALCGRMAQEATGARLALVRAADAKALA